MITNIKFNVKNIPEELKVVKAWICWRKEERNGRITKVPTNPYTGRNIDITDSKEWMSFEDAVVLSRSNMVSGIGFVFSKKNGFVGIDIDHCINANGQLSDLAEQIIKEIDSYTEISPSGKGIHIICKGTLPTGRNRNPAMGLEMYAENRYFTFTGNVYEGYCRIESREQELRNVYARYLLQGGKERTGKSIEKVKVKADNGNVDIEEIIERICKSRNGDRILDLLHGNWENKYSSQSEAELALMNAIAFWTGKDERKMDEIYRKSEMYRPKWDETHYADGRKYGEATIQKAINDCNSVYNGSTSKPSYLPLNPNLQDSEPLPLWYSKNDRNGNVKFLPGILAEHLKNTIPAIYAGGNFYFYENGVYVQAEGNKAMQIVQGHLRDEYLKSSHVKDAHELWKNKILRDIKDVNPEKCEHIINLKNGLYDIYTKEFRRHSPEYLTTVQLNCNYNPDAECKDFLTFIHEVLPPEIIPLAQEIIGYLLAPFTKSQKAFVLQGPPRTGKSTFLRIIEGIIGKGNISNVPWQELDNRFKTALLYGKLVNMFADLPNKPIEDAGFFKVLTGEDTIVAEHKFGTPFSFTNKARMIFSCNELPKNYGDRSEAFYRRLIILPFEHQIAEDKIDTKLTEKLMQEKDGIVLWALEGLERLLNNHFRFSETADTRKLVEQYKVDSDNVLWFVENYCEISLEKKVYSSVLYENYKKNCLTSGMQPVSQVKFNKTLENSYANRIVKGYEPGTKRAIYKGIALCR